MVEIVDAFDDYDYDDDDDDDDDDMEWNMMMMHEVLSHHDCHLCCYDRDRCSCCYYLFVVVVMLMYDLKD